MRGIIVRVRFKHFMVFTDLEFRPGPNLNVVIAPNGTGKSSLVSGIMLGLCAKPNDIGRANQLRDFVKTGYDEAKIEIELLNPGKENFIIERQFNRENKSTWHLNGQKIPLKRIEDLMIELNIQVSNLCQVLPQDRVHMFSRMNPQQLLESTQKSLGPAVLLQYHNDLKQMSNSIIEIENKLKDRTTSKEREMAANRGIEANVDMMVKKVRLMERIELYKQQRAWVMYREQYSLVQEMKNSVKEAKIKLLEQKEKDKHITNALETLNKDVAKFSEEVKRKNEEKASCEFKIQSLLVDFEKQKEALELVEEKFEEMKRGEEMRLKELEQLRQHLSKMECDLINYSSVSEEQTKEKINQITSSMANTNQKLTKIRHEEEILQDQIENNKHRTRDEQEKKRRLEDRAKLRLTLISKILPDVHRAIIWLRENSHEFTHKIYEPIMLEIDVERDSYIKYLEEAIPKRDLQAFTCEDKEDMNKFIRIIREQHNLAVNVLYSGPEHRPSSSFHPRIPMERLKRFGFNKFVKDMFTAPEPIMKYLCRTAGVYHIPVGGPQVDGVLDDLPPEVTYFFSESNKYFSRISKYSKEKCVTITNIPPPRLLTTGVDANEINRIEESIRKLTNEKNGLDSQIRTLQEKRKEQETLLGEMRDERRKLQAGIGGRELTERRIKAKREQIRSVEAERRNVDEESHNVESEKNMIIENICRINVKMLSLMQKLDEVLRDFARCNWKLQERKEILKKQVADNRSIIRATEEQAEMVKKLEDQFIKVRNEAKQLHAEALKYTNGKAPDESFYELITDNREVLSRKIQELQAKADFMSDSNHNVIKEFETRKKTIEELSKEIQNMTAKIADMGKQMATTREKWLPELNRVLSKLNENFGKSFEKLGCAGEVMLAYNDNDPDNYEEYGINIKVKFRDDDKLQDLNNFTQSGGERSVSTAVYMIAMQELTNVPFRCVDEINQGMDALNERRIFELLANVPAGDDTPQYFLLTPKLLPGLKYNSKMTVICIFNGSCAKMDCWDVRNQAQKRRHLETKFRKARNAV